MWEELTPESVREHEEKERSPVRGPVRTLNTFQLIFMSFFCVSGGGYGMEDGVRTGYPFYLLIALAVVPWLWSFPLALMTAELAAMMPENGGKIVWVRRSFGPFWAFQAGFWNLFYSLADNALYPAMFVNYLQDMTGPFHTGIEILLRFALIAVITTVNILGIQIVGKASILFACVVLSPFYIFSIWGTSHIDTTALSTKMTPLSAGPDWGLFLSVVLWNTSGWDNAASVAGEVSNPQKTYPRGLITAVILVTCSYLWPLSVGMSIDQNWKDWRVGYWPTVMGELGGPHFKLASSIIALVAAIGLFNVLMCTSSRILYALAPEDMIGWNRLASIHPRFKTPHVAILINAVGIGIFTTLPFQALIQIDVVLYSLSLMLAFVSLVRLRVKEPNAARPFRIPLPTAALSVFVTPPLILCLSSIIVSSWLTKIVGLIAVVTGFGLWAVLHYRRKRKETAEIKEEMEEFLRAEQPPAHPEQHVT